MKKFFHQLRHSALQLLLILTVAALSFGLWPSSPSASTTATSPGFEDLRGKIISTLMLQRFHSHYSQKNIDDALSEVAFAQFLKQLDYQKRFFLQKDIDVLASYRDKIDDQMLHGKMELPAIAYELFVQRVNQVSSMVDTLVKEPFDPESQAFFETDPEKRKYCQTEQELRDRWRNILRYEIISRFLMLQETETALGATPPDADDKENDKEQVVKKSEPALWAEAREKVRKKNQEVFHRLATEKKRQFYNRYFDAFARSFDPHSSYMPPREKEDFDIHMKGSLEGIGARLQEKDGFIKVVSIMPGGAAFRQGELEAGDIILKVGEGDKEPVDIVDMRIRDAVALIRGKKGTKVTLTVKKPDNRIVRIAIVRDVVQIEETFVKFAALPDRDSVVGYVQIPSFYRDFEKASFGQPGRNATDDVRKALVALKDQDIKGLVLDLRNNGGGALVDAISIAGLFFDSGPVVQIRDGSGKIRVREDRDKETVYGGPLVVLVNQLSASASEILAGALQDYNRAIIVGSEHTHGKGTVQTLIDLDSGLLWPNMQKYKPLGALKMTIQKFYRISGQSTQERGVIPDIILPDRYQGLEYGEKYLDNALPWDVIKPAHYSLFDMPRKPLADAQQKSMQRVEHSAAFQKIIKESKLRQQRREHTRVSLRLTDIKRERETVDAELQDDGISPHGDLSAGGEKKNGPLTAAERRQLWLDGVQKDPYVQEAIQILDGLASNEAFHFAVRTDPAFGERGVQ